MEAKLHAFLALPADRRVAPFKLPFSLFHFKTYNKRRITAALSFRHRERVNGIRSCEIVPTRHWHAL